MSEYAYFYSSKDGDRKYNADSFSSWLKQFFTDGVLANTMQVVANGDMTVTVAEGTGLIGGKVKVFDESTVLTLDTASGSYNRIDAIVLRRDDSARDFSLDVVTGTASASPSAPALTRSGNVYELRLANVYVTAGTVKITQSYIADTRGDEDECGYIAGNTETLDSEQLYAQNNAVFLEWFENIKGLLAEDPAGELQMEIEALTERVVILENYHSTTEAWLGSCYLGSAYLASE